MKYALQTWFLCALLGRVFCVNINGNHGGVALSLEEDDTVTEPMPSSDRAKHHGWKKPFQGNPSQRCWRTPGVVPITDLMTTGDDFVPEDPLSKTALASPEAMRDRWDRNNIRVRQPEDQRQINNNMLAAYHFRCPQGGAMTAAFSWGVRYRDGAANVDMVRWHNILDFVNTRLARQSRLWISTWDSMWCVPHDKLECWYLATGHTQGALNLARRTITIYLTPLNEEQFRNPTVFEFCDEIGQVPNFLNGHSCIIDVVQSHVVGPMA